MDSDADRHADDYADGDERFAAVAERVEPGGRLLERTTLPGGLSARTTVLLVEGPDHVRRRLSVRQARDPEAESHSLSLGHQFLLLQVLHAGGLPVPRPRLFDDSAALFPDPYAVFDYVDGAPRVTTTDPEGTGRMFARQLAAVHAVDIGAADIRAVDLPARLDTVSADLEAPPAVLDEALDEGGVRAVLRGHWPPPDPDRPMLLHGDFWAGNVLWSGERIVAVIDWEEAATGDRLVDVATTRLDLLWAFGRAAVAAFTDEYLTLTSTDPGPLPVWDLVAALRPVGAFSTWVADWADFGRPDMNATDMRAAHRWFVDQARAALGH